MIDNELKKKIAKTIEQKAYIYYKTKDDYSVGVLSGVELIAYKLGFTQKELDKIETRAKKKLLKGRDRDD